MVYDPMDLKYRVSNVLLVAGLVLAYYKYYRLSNT